MTNRTDHRGALTAACDKLYRWPAGYGSIVGRLHLHSDDGCVDGILAVEENGDIEVDITCPPNSYAHVAAAKDMAVAIHLNADRHHPFMVPERGEVRYSGGEDSILGPSFQVHAAGAPVDVRVKHGHIASVTEREGDVAINHSVLSCAQPTQVSDKFVFTNLSRTVRASKGGGVDAHQAISINYSYLGEMAVPVGVRVITNDGEGTHAWEAMWLEPNHYLVPDHAGQLTCE